MDDDETTEVIALSRSTVVLSRRRKRIAVERKSVPEADATIAERRGELLNMMEMLEIEKNHQHIEKKEAKVMADKLDQMKIPRKSDAYCIDCGLFYRSKTGCIPCPHCGVGVEIIDGRKCSATLAKYSWGSGR